MLEECQICMPESNLTVPLWTVLVKPDFKSNIHHVVECMLSACHFQQVNTANVTKHNLQYQARVR